MRKIATIDCETDPFLYGRIPAPFIWGFYSDGFYQKFNKTADLIEFLKTFNGIVYAHNGGKFDFHFLLDAIEADTKVLIINGRLAKLKIGKAELRDSWLLFPMPLAAYKKDDFDYKKLEKDVRADNMAEIEHYLYNDCLYLYEIIMRQINDYGLKISLPSSAFNFWFKEFSGLDKIPKSTKGFFNEFKPYYYGGRVECFQKGVFNNEFKSYDINSAYPFAMLHEHPSGSKFIRRTRLPDNEAEIRKSFISFIGTSTGCLPFRTKTGLSFPSSGEAMQFNATGWEVLEGLSQGNIRIDKIISVSTFHETINFNDYVQHFYKMKSDCKGVDAAGYVLAKLYLNSLYGKFAMNGEHHKDYITCNPWEVVEKIESGKSFCGELGNMALLSEPIAESRQTFYNVATAASITGFVRAYLQKHLIKAQNLMYCDTDSITCSSLDCKVGTELGDWEDEGSYTHGAIAGKKMYAYKHKNKSGFKIASKGVKLNEKEIFLVASGENILYKKDAPCFNVHKAPYFIERNINLKFRGFLL